MIWSFNQLRHSLLLLFFFASSACGGESGLTQETILFQLSSTTCLKIWLNDINTVQVELRTPESQRSGCIKVTLETIADLHKALSDQVSFRQVEPGEKSVIILGYEGLDCKENLTLCGHARFSLPSPTSTISLPVTCSPLFSPQQLQTCTGM